MKNTTKIYLTLIGLMLTFIKSNAQTTVTSTAFADRMNQIFANIDKSRVPYGILLDWGFEFANLSRFRGTYPLSDSTLTSTTAFWDVYNTLLMSRIHSSASGFVTPALLDERISFWRKNLVNGYVPGLHEVVEPGHEGIVLNGLFFNYSKYRSDAANNYVTISNNLLYDKFSGSTWLNPYQTENVFMIAPSTQVCNSTNFLVTFPAEIWLTNNGSAIANISIDFGDGSGFRSFSPDSYLLLSYTTSGVKTWTYKLTMTNGTTLLSYSKITVNSITSTVNNSGSSSRTTSSCVDYFSTSITATTPYSGAVARGHITIKYANSSNCLRKPLIVAEGFDTGSILNPESIYGDRSIKTFRNDIADDFSDLSALVTGTNAQYDIVYVDWANGTDYIQRNALLLEDVIDWVNANKVPYNGVMQPNVVMGQSMGGLVARYALRDMENKGKNHQTRLFVSHDAPHQGANVPVGYQHFSRHVKSIYVKAPLSGVVDFVQLIRGQTSTSEYLNLINAPAAKQMLINYVNDAGNVDNTIHNQWQQELKTMGYPTQCRNVAIANGSECALPQPYGAGASLLSFNGRGNTNIIGDMLLRGGILYTTISTGSPAFLLGFYPGRNEINFKFDVNAQADGTANQIYQGVVNYKKYILWLIPVSVSISNRTKTGDPSNLLYDSYPGGYYTINTELSSQSASTFFGNYGVTVSYQPSFNFIPTPSALDIGGGNTPLTRPDYTTRYVGAVPPASPKNSPFANFIAGYDGGNEQHISIFTRNGNWLAGELNSQNPRANCSGTCSSNSIAGGSDYICVNIGFSIGGGASGYSSTWSIASGIAATVNATTGVVTRQGNATGLVVLKATTSSSGCQPATYTRNLWAGFAPVSVISGPSSICPNSGGVFTAAAPGSSGYSYYGFSSSYGWIYQPYFSLASGSTSSSNPITLQTPSNFTGGSVVVYAFNQCGPAPSPAVYGVGRSNSCPNGLVANTYVVSPNPATTSVSIAKSSASTQSIATDSTVSTASVSSFAVSDVSVASKETTKETPKVEIFDKYLVCRKTYLNQDISKSIDIRGLESGLYYLVITDSQHTERHQLVVQ